MDEVIAHAEGASIRKRPEISFEKINASHVCAFEYRQFLRQEGNGLALLSWQSLCPRQMLGGNPDYAPRHSVECVDADGLSHGGPGQVKSRQSATDHWRFGEADVHALLRRVSWC